MTEQPRHPEDTDDLATQRLPRVEPPLPGSLNPVRERTTSEPPAQDSLNREAPNQEAAQEATAELSIDDRMGPSRSGPAPARVAVPPPPPVAPQATPTAAPTAAPSAAAEATAPAGPSMADRVRGDAGAAWASAVRRSRTWLGDGDNAVIAATAIVALLLLVMVAVL